MANNVVNIYNYVKQTKTYMSSISNELHKLNVEKSTSYSPIFKLLFKLNDGNSKTVLLDNKFQLYKINNHNDRNSIVIECSTNSNTTKPTKQNCFVKYAPLVDPFRYLCGEMEDYNMEDDLPVFNISDQIGFNSIINSPYNTAYVDCFFSYLSSQLKHKHNFRNGVDFYGSFCGIKSGFKVSITDELSLLNNSTFFMKNKNKLFNIDNNGICDNSIPAGSRSSSRCYRSPSAKKEPLTISNSVNITVDELNEQPLKELFYMADGDKGTDINEKLREVVFNSETLDEIHLEDMISQSSSHASNCSSRTSHTSHTSHTEDVDDATSIRTNSISAKSYTTASSFASNESGEGSSQGSSDSESVTHAYINNFPVNIIFLEKCHETLDAYIENNELEEREMKAILLQIAFTLATYQRCYNFTHNDLHTSNIMYTKTNDKYLYYALIENGPVYKIPTYGKLWKIIDFGRSIYNISNSCIENTAFSDIGDATTQYNFGRLYSDKYNLRYPNKNFDLCRLACSLFDYVFDSDNDIYKVSFDEKMNQLVFNDDVEKYSIENLILRWTTGNDNRNILYKSNGDERYPGFKLYKMITIKANDRCCPFTTIRSPYFQDFIVTNRKQLSKIHKNNLFVVEALPECYTLFGDEL